MSTQQSQFPVRPVVQPSSVAGSLLLLQGQVWAYLVCALTDALFLYSIAASLLLARSLLIGSPLSADELQNVLIVLVALPVFAARGLYRRLHFSEFEEFCMVTKACLLSFLVVTALTFAAQESESLSRFVIAGAFLLATLLLPRVRQRVRPWVQGFSGSDPAALLVTDIKPSESIWGDLNPLSFIKRAMRVRDVHIYSVTPNTATQDLVRHIQQLKDSIQRLSVVLLLNNTPPARQRDLIRALANSPNGVLVIPYLGQGLGPQCEALDVTYSLGIRIENLLASPSAIIGKRAMDVALTLLIIVLLSPLLLLAAAIVRITSSGPILFTQERLGRDGRTFRVFKFRSMRMDADQVLRAHLASSPEARREWETSRKLKHDPRATPCGRLLRRSSIDELPQLLNVLRGEMSLVGPRPIVPDEVDRYGSIYEMYRQVRPGISGLWQVSGRNDVSYDARVRYDEYYVRNWSILLDLFILLKTPGIVLQRRGAY